MSLLRSLGTKNSISSSFLLQLRNNKNKNNWSPSFSIIFRSKSKRTNNNKNDDATQPSKPLGENEDAASKDDDNDDYNNINEQTEESKFATWGRKGGLIGGPLCYARKTSMFDPKYDHVRYKWVEKGNARMFLKSWAGYFTPEGTARPVQDAANVIELYSDMLSFRHSIRMSQIINSATQLVRLHRQDDASSSSSFNPFVTSVIGSDPGLGSEKRRRYVQLRFNQTTTPPTFEVLDQTTQEWFPFQPSRNAEVNKKIIEHMLETKDMVEILLEHEKDMAKAAAAEAKWKQQQQQQEQEQQQQQQQQEPTHQTAVAVGAPNPK